MRATNSRLTDIFEKTAAHLSATGDEESAEIIRRMLVSRAEDRFRIVLAGGVSRGKSRLLNRLLASDLLPEGPLPTTAILTEIAWGSEGSAVFHGPAYSVTLAAERSALEKFSAEESLADKPGILKITWPAPFLEPDLVICDTPGIDDGIGRRADITYNSLEQADAALIVVAATTPVSLLEKSFIEACAVRRSVPRVAVVVTFMDIIPEAERKRQLRHICKKTAAIDPDLPVWLAEDLTMDGASLNGAVAIRERLHAWAADGERARLLNRRDLRACHDLVAAGVARWQNVLSSLEAESGHSQRALLDAWDALDARRAEWQELRAGFLERGSAAVSELTATLDRIRSETNAACEANAARDFRLQLRTRLIQGAREINECLRQRLDSDRDALERAVGARFGIRDVSALETKKAFSIAVALPDVTDHNAGDIFATLVNFARSILKEIAPLLPVPVLLRGRAREMIDSILVNLAGCLGARQGSGMGMGDVINDFFITLKKQVDAAVGTLYAETAEALCREQERWLKQQREMTADLHDPAKLAAKMAAARTSIAAGEAIMAEIEKQADFA